MPGPKALSATPAVALAATPRGPPQLRCCPAHRPQPTAAASSASTACGQGAAGRPASGRRLAGLPSGLNVTSLATLTTGRAAASDVDPAFSLRCEERQGLVAILLGQEELLKAAFDKAFLGVASHSPSDLALDRCALWQEAPDAQLVANAEVMAAAKNAVLPPATALKESTPGGLLIKEAAARPCVLNVDAMLSEFLAGSGSEGALGGGGAGPRGDTL
ncbi:hypothetical protein GPECTOR_10g1138 [Gonium pectorale]|uniref:Uncharacterized protein n=1 Tax=Gonium pectorale TaxID=33097 RepID=A0A150GQL4_GONPE|nr:hypothetical protein GPECTOR_10g1138 [Gonium pectorale]|eukprot:KXZ52115.1 hypothetical protein GPECTOR_10g1138 [Gonium pectorale]